MAATPVHEFLGVAVTSQTSLLGRWTVANWSPKTLGDVTGAIYIAFDTPREIDAVYARAKGAGAEITRELCDTDYGSHEFGVRDPEGHVWSFGTYRPQAS